MSFEHFHKAYRGNPPWEIGRAQGAFGELARAGALDGDVLDMGCGTGDNALLAAAHARSVWGLDAVPAAIERAREKAERQGLDVTFRVGNALFAHQLRRSFDTILDSGLFHVFADPDREAYVRSLERVLRPGGILYLLCFSDLEPGDHGPRRVTQDEIRAAFADGWTVEDIREAHFEHNHEGGDARAWLAVIRRDESAGGPY